MPIQLLIFYELGIKELTPRELSFAVFFPWGSWLTLLDRNIARIVFARVDLGGAVDAIFS